MDRANVIKFMKKLWRETTPNTYAEQAFETAIELLREGSRWVPCSERLPEKNENVILQVNGFAPDENTDYYHCPCIGRYVGKLGENGTALWWIEPMKSMTDMRAVTVEAWMPLPDPFEPEE